MSLNEFLGRKASDFMDPEMQPYFKTEYLEKLKNEGRYEGISRYTAKDGRKILIEYHSTLVYPDDGEPYISGTGRDVTERIQSRKQLKVLREQVAQAEKMKAVGVLAGGVAHDFNNLLMGIQGNASLMLLSLDTGHPHFEKLKHIEKYVQQGADLTRQLLGFARGGKYEVKPTDINRLLEDELRLFMETHKEIVIEKQYQEGIWTVDVDRSQIVQALMNIFINAWQAMGGGGVLRVQTQNVVIDEQKGHVHQVDPGKYVKISIEDSGAGMDEATLDRIFEPFFTTKEMGRGTGLGLASVYGTIKNHDGFIQVASQPGEGTSFHVTPSGHHVTYKRRRNGFKFPAV
jgi:two-component system cell cycle sensor histidine kinase/response regulator CckA